MALTIAFAAVAVKERAADPASSMPTDRQFGNSASVMPSDAPPSSWPSGGGCGGREMSTGGGCNGGGSGG